MSSPSDKSAPAANQLGRPRSRLLPRGRRMLRRRALTPDDPYHSLLNTLQAARLLGLSSSTLSKSRLTGEGPRFVKLGASVRYRRSDLEAFVNANMRLSTSECAPAFQSMPAPAVGKVGRSW